MRVLLPLFLLLSGCGRYARFSMPAAGPAEPGAYSWHSRPVPVIPNLAVDTLNPSVIRWKDGLLNLLSIYDGRTWYTAAAFSTGPLGLDWSPPRPVLSPEPRTWEGNYIAANGAAIVFRNEILYYYQAGSPPRIGLARSADGEHWSREAQPVLDFGPRGAWDERAAADPYVLEAAGKLYLFYLGEDRARRQRLGLAVSGDGVHWTKHKDSPILEPGEAGAFDENGLGEPAVWQAHGSYWMLFTGRARNEFRRLGLARSSDGVHWTRTPLVISGSEPWNAKVLCDPTVIVDGDAVRVWFGAGDTPHPAENIHGQIGYADLLWK